MKINHLVHLVCGILLLLDQLCLVLRTTLAQGLLWWKKQKICWGSQYIIELARICECYWLVMCVGHVSWVFANLYQVSGPWKNLLLLLCRVFRWAKISQGHKTRTTRRSRVGASSWVQKCKQLFCLLLECSECSGQGFLAFGFEPPTWSKVHGEGLAK
jgi:hypothetical protein